MHFLKSDPKSKLDPKSKSDLKSKSDPRSRMDSIHGLYTRDDYRANILRSCLGQSPDAHVGGHVHDCCDSTRSLRGSSELLGQSCEAIALKGAVPQRGRNGRV